jgi:acetolactate synthase small subunit
MPFQHFQCSSENNLLRHILNCLVQNEPGVLSRVSGILAGRGFNIDSLVVCRTEIRDLSRMCIVLSGQDGVVEQARRQLEDLVRLSLFHCLISLL